MGRAGSSYLDGTLLDLRQDHAAAVDAVRRGARSARDLGVDLIEQFGLIEVCTRAASKGEYLMRPDLGRRLSDPGRGGPGLLPEIGDVASRHR